VHPFLDVQDFRPAGPCDDDGFHLGQQVSASESKKVGQGAQRSKKKWPTRGPATLYSGGAS
jgi:hypothetical protein